MSKNFRKHDILREQSTNKIVHVSDLDFFPSAIISSFEKQWIDEKQFV